MSIFNTLRSFNKRKPFNKHYLYTMKKTRLLTKTAFVVLLTLVVTVFCSCTLIYEELFKGKTYDIDFNQIVINSVARADWYATYSYPVDTMSYDAVALRLLLSDSITPYYAPSPSDTTQEHSGSLLKTKVSRYYEPRNKVVGMKIRTLYPINTTLHAGDDITEQFQYVASQNRSLHNTWEAFEELNQAKERAHNVVFVLNKNIENTEAQFEITVALDNGVELVGTTERFVIAQE